MTVKEYFEAFPHKDTTFIIARAIKDGNTPFYHCEYRTTPLRSVDEWKHCKDIMECIVLNNKQPSITWLTGVDWNPNIQRGFYRCMLIIPQKDFKTMYSEKQRNSMIEYIDNKIYETV